MRKMLVSILSLVLCCIFSTNVYSDTPGQEVPSTQKSPNSFGDVLSISSSGLQLGDGDNAIVIDKNGLQVKDAEGTVSIGKEGLQVNETNDSVKLDSTGGVIDDNDTDVTEVAIQDNDMQSIAVAGNSGKAWQQDIHGGNFNGQDLSGTLFSSIDIRDADFSNANLSGAQFQNVDLSNVNFSSADLSRVTFANATAINVNFSKANVSSANITNSDFENVDMRETCLLQAELINTDFLGGDLSGAYVVGVTFINTDYDGTIQKNLVQEGPFSCPGTDLTRPQLTKAVNIEKALLQGAGAEISLTVNFEHNSDKIVGAAHAQLFEIAKALKSNGLTGSRIRVEGHTDSSGDDNYNNDLSYRRAISVVKTLTMEYQISDANLEVHGMGESKPIASNSTQKGKALNRRVTLVNIGEPKG